MARGPAWGRKQQMTHITILKWCIMSYAKDYQAYQTHKKQSLRQEIDSR